MTSLEREKKIRERKSFKVKTKTSFLFLRIFWDFLEKKKILFYLIKRNSFEFMRSTVETVGVFC